MAEGVTLSSVIPSPSKSGTALGLLAISPQIDTGRLAICAV